MGMGCRVDAAVHQDQVIEMRIECVTLQTRRMIDQRAIAAQFPDEDLIAQGLRRGQILGRGRQPHGIGAFFGRHHFGLALCSGLDADLT